MAFGNSMLSLETNLGIKKALRYNSSSSSTQDTSSGEQFPHYDTEREALVCSVLCDH